jgi:hypothetical protein
MGGPSIEYTEPMKLLLVRHAPAVARETPAPRILRALAGAGETLPAEPIDNRQAAGTKRNLPI